MQTIGHRGCALAPENTMSAFRKAAASGAAVELDVQVSSDGVICVMHDDTLDRTTDGTGPLSSRTWAELSKLDAGSWYSPEYKDEKIPRLDEVLDWAKGQYKLFIEIKDGPRPENFTQQLIQAIADRQMEKSVTIISFDKKVVQEIEQASPEITTGILYAPEPSIAAKKKGLKAGAIGGALLGLAGGPLGVIGGAIGGAFLGGTIGHALETRNLIKQFPGAGVDMALPHWIQLDPVVTAAAHKQGQQVVAYTMNHPFLVKTSRWIGVDGVISDHPERHVAGHR